MITVVKRNQERVPLDLNKIQRQVAHACQGIDNVSPSMIEISAKIQFADGMSTRTIDELLLKAMVDLIDESENPEINHVNYQYVAGRQRLSMLRKEVYGQYKPPRLYEIVKKNVELGAYTPELLEWYTEAEWDIIDLFIDHEKDEKYSYAAIAQLIEKYLVQNRATGKVYETPQVRYAIAAATAFHMEAKDVRLKYVKDYYECGSDGQFTLATPVLAGLGTNTKQFSSCVLISVDDTLDSIFASGEMMAKYAAKRAGIGLEIGRIRPMGAPIRGGELKHTGILPFMHKWYRDLRSCSQGLRNASCSVFYPIWHFEYPELIVVKNNQGTEETRVRQMDYGVVLSAMFWRRYKNGENITLFDPHEVPDLYEAFYRNTERFEKLYCEYENRADLRKRVFTAEEIFKSLMKERTDTGRIYMVYIDNSINQGPFDAELDPIYQSNLCCVTGDTEIEIQYYGYESKISIAKLTEQWNSAQNDDTIFVKSWDGEKIVWSAISNAMLTKHVTELVKIETSFGTVKCTPDHKIFTSTRGWVEAQHLEITDQLLGYNNGNSENIVAIISSLELLSEEPVYDITVEDTHSFFANGVLVHNCEILLPTKPFQRIEDERGSIALCTLGSANWGAFRDPQQMRKACRVLVRSLSNLLGYQDFLSIQSKLANEDFEPLGVGITNLAYWHAKRNMKYGDPESLAEVKRWMEHQAYYLTEASVELAQERGACGRSEYTYYGKGVFPWERRANGVNELTDFTPSLDWEPLREKMKQYGIRNGTLMAIAPVESCQSWKNKLALSDGTTPNFHEFLESMGIDWKEIENTAEAGDSVKLPHPVLVKGKNGDEQVTEVIYNGFKRLNQITFEDGTIMEFTDNHRLLVNHNGKEKWVYAFELTEGNEIIGATRNIKIKTIKSHVYEDHTWDISTPSHSYQLPNGCISHNSSVVLNSTNGIEMPMDLISVKESKAGSFVQVVPEYKRLKNRYQLMWDQTDCIGYLKTAAVLAAYVDQSISTNTFYNPKHFKDGKVPGTLVAKNLMLAHKYGLKSLYYSLISKQGVKTDEEVKTESPASASSSQDSGDDGDCLSCKL